jgi:HrpA-like RNA helicase
VKLLEGKEFGSLMLGEFLAKAVEAPPAASVKNAVQLLENLGALTPVTEALTPLGRHLASLPLPPRVSKMLLYAILFGVLDPILTVACCIAYRLASPHPPPPTPPSPG